MLFPLPKRERFPATMQTMPSNATCARTPSDRGLVRCALLLCCLSTVGCSLLAETHRVFFLAKRTTELEPKHFRYLKNEKLTRKRNVGLAKQVWAEVAAGSDAESYSKHYMRGFIDGFADYLYRGGTGEAPLVPPRDYWRLGYQTAAGKQAIEDWFAGFRHGVDECRARGYREMAVVPSSLIDSYAPSPRDISSRDESWGPDTDPGPEPAEVLPTPAPNAADAAPADDTPADDVEPNWEFLEPDASMGTENADGAFRTILNPPTSAQRQQTLRTQQSARTNEMARLNMRAMQQQKTGVRAPTPSTDDPRRKVPPTKTGEIDKKQDADASGSPRPAVANEHDDPPIPRESFD